MSGHAWHIFNYPFTTKNRAFIDFFVILCLAFGMSTITLIKTPAQLLLSKYIICYVYRNIIIDNREQSVKKIMPPNPVASLDFFFGHPFKTIDFKAGVEIPYKTTAIRGCRTSGKFAIEIKKSFSSFSIKFTPTGLYSILGMDMSQLTDGDIACVPLKDHVDLNLIHTQIKQCENQNQRIEVVEKLILTLLSKQTRKARLIPEETLFEDNSNQPIFLSARQQQRLFKKEIGLSPKSFYNLKRFSNLLKAKKMNIDDNWTSLAYKFGYFDQSHLIKDFHTFLGIAPSGFNSETYAI